MKQPFKVGDLIASYSERFPLVAGTLFQVTKVEGDVIKYHRIGQDQFTGLTFSQLNLLDEGITWKRFSLELVRNPRGPKKKRCVCHSQDLFNFGCKCGGL